MKQYRSHKIVSAGKIVSAERLDNTVIVTTEDGDKIEVGPNRVHDMEDAEIVGGYVVVYTDGYISWSPADAFEGGYTLVEEAA
jgi:hypothetical protein